MPIVRANPQGIIQSVSAVPVSGPDGVIRSASSGYLQDSAGIMRRIYIGADSNRASSMDMFRTTSNKK